MDIERPEPPNRLADRVRDTIEFVGVARLAVTAASVLLVAAGGWWLVRAPAPPIERSLPLATGATESSVVATTTASTLGGAVPPPSSAIVVQAAGAVVRPGVYELPAGSRLHELLVAAGGALDGADPDALALASLLADGQRVYVPLLGETIPAGAGSAVAGAPAGPLDLNRATAEQLDALPGVGPATAEAIVAHRSAHGPFATIEGLLDVRGIGPAKLESLVGLVTV